MGNNFNYPTQWDQAGTTWDTMAKGNYSNAGMDWLKNLLGSGGSQAALGKWGEAQQPAMMDQYSNMVKQMAEQAGVGGTRYSSGLQGQIANYGGQLQNQFQSNLMDRWLQAQGQDVGMAGSLANMGLGASQTGAEGLLSLGGARAQLPLQVAQTQMGLGQGMSGDQQNWYQLMNSIINGTQNQQQQYTPNAFQSILQSLSGTLGNDLEKWDAKGWW
jgi:hypothetical protein